MFFIGIFGIEQKEKLIDSINNFICPSCGSLTKLDVYKLYSYFHIFFIPTFKWNIKYIAKSHCCHNVFELSQNAIKSYKKSEKPTINENDLKPLNINSDYTICFNCKNKVNKKYNYCPYCGKEL